MLVITLSPEAMMDIFKAGQTFQNADGTRLYTVTNGIPTLPLVGLRLGSSTAVNPFPAVPDCTVELCLDDGQSGVTHQTVEVHCAESQGLPHDFDAYAQQVYLTYHGVLDSDPLFPWHKLRPIVQAAWRSVAVRIARLTTHTLAEQAGRKDAP